MGAPLIWAGNFAKFLKAQLNLSDQAYVLTGTADPTVTATLAPAGSLYMKVSPDVSGQTNYTPGGVSLHSPGASPFRAGDAFLAPVTAPITTAGTQLKRTGATTGNLVYEIWSTTAGVPTALIATSNPIAANSLPLNTLTLQLFTFATTVTLTAGTTYGGILNNNGLGTPNNVQLAYDGVATAGIVYTDNQGAGGGLATTFANTAGFTFSIQVNQFLSGTGKAGLYLKEDGGSSTNWRQIADANGVSGLELEMQIDDWASQGPYALWTPNILAQTSSAQISALTGTAAYDAANQVVTFGTIADTMTTIQQLDSGEFLSNPNGILSDIGQADVLVYWKRGSIDSSATYALSRDGGGTFQTVTMQNAGSATDAFYGSLTFANTESLATFVSHSTGAALQVLQNNPSKFAEKVVVPANTVWVVQDIVLNVSSSSAAPGSRLGNFFVNIVKDSSGTPSTATTDILVTSTAVAASSLTSGADNTFAVPNTVLAPGTYWITWFGDATYYTGGNLVFITDASSGGNWASFNGTTWSSNAGDFKSSLQGRVLDLRLKITAGTANTKLAATAVAYNLSSLGQTSTVPQRQAFSFNSLTNTNSFTLTQFTPDPNLLVVNHVETGLTYVYGLFSLQGNTIVFPANFFNPDGISRTVTLIANQNQGGSYNNADQNALLLAANHLGSTDATIDKSLAGFGPILKRPDGTLRMIALDNFDNLTISSVP